jgi:hypothetical protein
VGVVRAAAQLEIVSGCRTPIGKRYDMVILEKSLFRAAARCALERASAFITFPHDAFHTCRNMTTMCDSRLSNTRPVDRRMLGLVQLAEEQRQCTIDNRSNVSVWNAVPK